MQLVEVMFVGMLVLYMSVHLLLIAGSMRETCVTTVRWDGPLPLVVHSTMNLRQEARCSSM